MRFTAVFLLYVSVHMVAAQTDVNITGNGETGTIAYGETVTGELEVSAASDISSISYVGHNGANRIQGDFDVWKFDVQKGANVIIRMTVTDGNFAPTLLITNEDSESTASVFLVVNLDNNVDGDGEAGVCLRDVPQDNQYAIIVYRQQNVPGKYSLSLEKVDSAADLSAGSTTAICSVGSFVSTSGNTVINIRSGPGKRFPVKNTLQPGQLYSLAGGDADWTHVLFYDGDELTDGYVSTPLIRITGTAHNAAEATATPG